jgi:hypothetical protein
VLMFCDLTPLGLGEKNQKIFLCFFLSCLSSCLEWRKGMKSMIANEQLDLFFKLQKERREARVEEEFKEGRSEAEGRASEVSKSSTWKGSVEFWEECYKNNKELQ